MPTGTNLDEMFADSSVSAISLEIPGLLNSIASVTLTNTGGTGHDAADPLTYEITIQNEASAAEGTYTGLVKVTDTYPTGADTNPLLGGQDGIERVDPTESPLAGLFSIPEFATYQFFTIEVGPVGNYDPIAVLEPDPVTVSQGFGVMFDGTGSYDTDGTITLYEFDYEWDGNEANFVADESNTTGMVFSDPCMTLGNFTAGLRVTDNGAEVGYDSVSVTVEEYNSPCPIAPYAGGSFTDGLLYSNYRLYSRSTDPDWNVHADLNIDMDCLSNGEGVLVYACDRTDEGATLFHGSLRRIDTSGNWLYTIVDGDYPGYRCVSVDADRSDLVILVTSDLPHADQITVPPEDKYTYAHDYLTIVDPFVGSSSEQIVDVGTTIIAVETDADDNIWVLDTENIMHKFVKDNNYAEDYSWTFDLDTTSGGTFNNMVYDFVINFYNEAFYILTENDDDTKVDVWRFECDGVYNSTIGGNPNPMTDILNPDSSQSNDVEDMADITIDNLDSSGDLLTGAQDAQIVVVGNMREEYWWSHGMVARIDAELNQLVDEGYWDQFNDDGISCACMDQIGNTMFGWAGGVYGDSWTTHWSTPAGWQ